jgi:hypothetical protein
MSGFPHKKCSYEKLMTIDSIPPHQWEDLTKIVCEAMIAETDGFTTPISKVIEHDYGILEGTGSYIQIEGKRYLFTNEHVAACLKTHSIAYQFCGCADVHLTTNPFPVIEYPQDVAICEIDDSIWNNAPHKGKAILAERFAAKHSPTDGEFLFLVGYAADRSKFVFQELHSERLPYLTQSREMPSGWGIPDVHFALHYKPDSAIATNPRSLGLPCPPGMSGSLVWNTRYVEAQQAGRMWSPKDAQVTGIVWGWPSSDACLLATKVEYFDLPLLLAGSK